jgi:hypothetical protein
VRLRPVRPTGHVLLNSPVMTQILKLLHVPYRVEARPLPGCRRRPTIRGYTILMTSIAIFRLPRKPNTHANAYVRGLIANLFRLLEPKQTSRCAGVKRGVRGADLLIDGGYTGV